MLADSKEQQLRELESEKRGSGFITKEAALILGISAIAILSASAVMASYQESAQTPIPESIPWNISP